MSALNSMRGEETRKCMGRGQKVGLRTISNMLTALEVVIGTSSSEDSTAAGVNSSAPSFLFKFRADILESK